MYRTKKNKIKSFNKAIDILENIFINSIKNSLKSNNVALFLSGGIDSGLIGYYLKKIGVKIETITSMPSGLKSSEAKYSKINFKKILPDKKIIDYFNTENLNENYYNHVLNLYKTPISNPASLSITNIWKNYNLDKQEQIFFGQNADVITNAMDNRYILYFMIRFFMNKEKALKNFLKCKTDNLIGQPLNIKLSKNLKITDLPIILNIYFLRTPADSELFAQPAINKNISIANPYYNLNLIEFLMGLPLKYKIKLFKNKKNILSLDKKILRSLALKNSFPQELVKRKKGFTTPFYKNKEKFIKNLPDTFNGIKLRNKEQKFSIYMLKKWLR